MQTNFDFDEWMALASNAPDEFDRRRRLAIEQLIYDGNVNVRQMQGLQFRIDMERVRARRPLKGCLRISELMWSQFLHFRDAMNTAAFLVSHPMRKCGSTDREIKNVIPFPSNGRAFGSSLKRHLTTGNTGETG